MSRQFLNMTAEQYHAAEGLSSSGIRCFMTKGNLEFYARYVRMPRKVIADTDAMKLGRAFHLAMSDPDKWEDSYVVMPLVVPDSPLLDFVNAAYKARKSSAKPLIAGEEWNFKLPTHRDLKDAWKADALEAGKELLSVEDAERVKHQVAAVYDNPACREYVGTKTVNVEVACFADDPRLPIPLKALIDLVVGETVVDFKTHHECNAFDFLREADRRSYHYQLAHYCMVAAKSAGVVISVNQEDPFESHPFRMPDGKLKRLKERLNEQVDRISQIFEGLQFSTGQTDSFGTPPDWHSEGWGGELPLDIEEFLNFRKENQ